LTYCGYDAITVISLSIIAAYLSYWVGLFLIALQKFYSWLRKRLNKQK
jgi:H+/Cl- antiporter ClcA